MNDSIKADALVLIANERERQQEVEAWTHEHDDEHKYGELAAAAASYAEAASGSGRQRDALAAGFIPATWPWSAEWWKPSTGSAPSDKIRELVKAGALIVAEIERLQRVEQKVK